MSLPDDQQANSVNSDVSSEEKAPLLGQESNVHAPLTTRRRFLIGPIVTLYLIGYTICNYTVTEYTRRALREQEYARVHLKVENVTINASCETNRSSLVYTTEAKATSLSSEWVMYYNLANGASSVFSNIILLSYTDVLGRKFLLTAVSVATTARLVLSTLIIYTDMSLYVFLIASFVEGLGGQYTTMMQVSTAYMCDITSPGKQRTRGVIYVEVMMGIGVTASSFLGGYLIQEFSYLVAILTASIMLILNLIIILTILPESNRKEKRTSNRKSLLHISRQSLRFFTENDSENKRWKYWTLVIAHGASMVATACQLSTEVLYQIAEPFCWNAIQIGIYATVRVFVQLTVGLATLHVLQNFLDISLIAAFGRCSYAISFFIEAIANTDVLLFVALGVNFLGPAGTIMTRSIFSQLTPADRQGAIFAAFGAVEVLCNLLSAVQTSAVYAATVANMRGLVFLVLGSYEAVSTVLLLILYIGWKVEKKSRP